MCPTGRTALPPSRSVHGLQEARSQGCAKGEEKQGNTRVSLSHGLCPTGALRKYLRKLLAGLGRWVRASVSVLIALLWAVVIFWPILEPTRQAPHSLSILCHQELTFPLVKLRCAVCPSSTLLRMLPSPVCPRPEPLPGVTLPAIWTTSTTSGQPKAPLLS